MSSHVATLHGPPLSTVCRSAAQAEVLTPREVPAFIDVTLAFLEHCNWNQVAIAPKHGE